MKMKIFFSVLAILILVSGCTINPFTIKAGSGNLVKETREVNNFDQVELDGFGNVILSQGKTESLVIEAEDNLLPYITTRVKGNTLQIGFKNNISVTPTRPVRYHLTVTDLESLTLSGGCNLEANKLETEQLAIDMNGGGSINFDHLETDLLEVKFSGAGGFEASGVANRQTIRFDGAGGYEAGDLESQDVKITIDGLGSATLWVDNSLDLTINGAGQISYYGEPKISQRTNGIGNITSLGLHQ